MNDDFKNSAVEPDKHDDSSSSGDIDRRANDIDDDVEQFLREALTDENSSDDESEADAFTPKADGDLFDDDKEEPSNEVYKPEMFQGAAVAPAAELTYSQQMARDRFLLDPKRRIKALAEQRYHLPGLNWKEDWLQYFANNHPIFGICFHFPEHPIGWPMRFMCFLSSAVFGLAITNAFWLWARSTENNSTLFTVETGTRPGANLTGLVVDVNDDNNVQVTNDMVLLWTVGGLLHGLFDNLVWTLSICACCDPGAKYEALAKYKRFGIGLLSFFLVLIMAVTTLSVVVRGVVESDDESADVKELKSAGVFDDQLDLSSSNKENYEFLTSYTVELALALLAYFPLTGTILFSGILGCNVIPQLGGRPLEVRKEEEELNEILQNPDAWEEEDDDDDPEDEPVVWGMKQPSRYGDTGGSNWALLSIRDLFKRGGNDDDEDAANNNSEKEKQNGTTDDDLSLPSHISRQRDASELDWSSYPSVNTATKREEGSVVGGGGQRRNSQSSATTTSKEASDLDWSSYPAVNQRNRKEKVDGLGGRSSAHNKPARKAADLDWSSYPTVNKRNATDRTATTTRKSGNTTRKSNAGRSSASSSSTSSPPPRKASNSKNGRGKGAAGDRREQQRVDQHIASMKTKTTSPYLKGYYNN